MPPTQDVRSGLLQVIAEKAPKTPGSGHLQSGSILQETLRRLGGSRELPVEEAILTGYPFFHITERGRQSLAAFSRDPCNPDGYLSALSRTAKLTPIADSYLREALACFVHDLPKSAAVMVGAASEGMALELRDAITKRVQSLNRSPPKGMDDWRLKVVLDSMYNFFDENGGQMTRQLRDAFRSYWPAFVHQIRSARNDAGHPSSIEPVTYDTIHASLLIFPELAKLTQQLLAWVSEDYN